MRLFNYLLPIILLSCTHVPAAQEQQQLLYQATGLAPIREEEKGSHLLGKVHRGYKVAVRFQMGDVWGRYGARLAAGEIGRELGGIWGFLTGQYQHISGSIVGSPVDRLLSEAIGQPLSLTATMTHAKPNVSRLDILSSFSTIKPFDRAPERALISYLGAGSLYADDPQFADRVLKNTALRNSLTCFRSQYIRVDERGATFLFAGSENEYSAMIRECRGYNQLIIAVLDSLAELSDLSS